MILKRSETGAAITTEIRLLRQLSGTRNYGLLRSLSLSLHYLEYRSLPLPFLRALQAEVRSHLRAHRKVSQAGCACHLSNSKLYSKTTLASTESIADLAEARIAEDGETVLAPVLIRDNLGRSLEPRWMPSRLTPLITDKGTGRKFVVYLFESMTPYWQVMYIPNDGPHGVVEGPSEVSNAFAAIARG